MTDNNNDKLNKVIKAISSAGGTVFYVGGCVRDRILGKENKDIDLEIHEITLADLKEVLLQFGRVNEVGVSFGILKLEGLDVDFALPRKEIKVGDKHVDFEVEVDPQLGLTAAARRRDFTMNAIYENALTGEIFDPFNGISDLNNGIINLVNEDTFVEDSLRPLRAAQLAARLDLRVSEEVIALSKTMNFIHLSKERIAIEFQKALLSPKPSVAFKALLKMGVLDQIVPELADMKQVVQPIKWHPEGDVFNHTMLVIDMAAQLKDRTQNPLAFMYSALLHDVGKAATTVVHPDGKITAHKHEFVGAKMVRSTIARMTNQIDFIPYIETMVANHMRAHKILEMRDHKIRKLMTVVPIEELLLLAVADSNRGHGLLSAVEREKFIEKSQRIRSLEQGAPFRIVLSITGKDLIALGMTPGPKVGAILSNLFDSQLNGASKDELIRSAKRQVDKVNKKKIN